MFCFVFLNLSPRFTFYAIFATLGNRYSAWRDGPERMGAPTVAVLVNAGLTYYNGNYYSQRVIANEARCRTLEIEKNKSNLHGGDSIACVNKQDDDSTFTTDITSSKLKSKTN